MEVAESAVTTLICIVEVLTWEDCYCDVALRPTLLTYRDTCFRTLPIPSTQLLLSFLLFYSTYMSVATLLIPSRWTPKRISILSWPMQRRYEVVAEQNVR